MNPTSSNQKKEQIKIGVAFSTTGPYGGVGKELQNGALLALSQINADPTLDFELIPVICDPCGELQEYYAGCKRLLKEEGIRHVVGCYTSSSRKEVIPVFEKYDGLLWYPSHYEGFEHCANVIYTGAAPNQHIVPLMSHMIKHYGNNVYCIGSNYIWGWESNRIMRECVTAYGGSIFCERYVPVGSVDVAKFVDEIIRTKPSYIFSSLIGVSSETFMRALHEARENDPTLTPEVMPVCSNTLSEPELVKLGAGPARGHIASSVYFQSKERPENYVFIAAYKERYGENWVTSADAEAAFNTCHLLAMSLQKARSDDVDTIKRALYEIELEAPQGKVWVDASNNHCYLTPSLGVSNETGQFDIIQSAPEPVRPDPYLINFDARSLIDAPNVFGITWAPPVSSDDVPRIIQ